MDLKDIVGKVATVCTIAVFLSGTEICRKIWKKKSTSDISALPFLCGLTSCCLWLRYGLLVNDSALIIVNCTGGFLQVLYILWYLNFTPIKTTFYKQLISTVCIISLLYLYTSYWVDHDTARYVSGMAACSGAVIFMASPLSAVARVLKTKNTDSLPFPFIMSTFVMATLWVCYGVLVDDLFVQVPNFLGAVLALCQLCLFAIYPSKKVYYELGAVI